MMRKNLVCTSSCRRDAVSFCNACRWSWEGGFTTPMKKQARQQRISEATDTTQRIPLLYVSNSTENTTSITKIGIHNPVLPIYLWLKNRGQVRQSLAVFFQMEESINNRIGCIMRRPNSEAALAVSSQISHYILNRARETYLSRIRTEAINERSLQLSKQFPVDCTQQLMELAAIIPAAHPSSLPEEHQLLPGLCRDYHRPLRTTNATPRSSAKPTDRTISIRPKLTAKKVSERGEREEGVGGGLRYCGEETGEEEAEIEWLREKKQRVFELQRYFVQEERAEKSKLRHKQSEVISHGNFTTDFNGERIEMKGVGRREADPYLMVEMASSIREEREQNRCHIQQPPVKKKTTRKESCLQETKQEGGKVSREWGLEAFTLKEIENFMSREKKRKVGKVSKVRIPELLSFMKLL